MHSIELLLDAATDARVRRDWQALVDAGLPSQGRHGGASNAPHVTLLVRDTLDDSHDAELRGTFRELPVRAPLGGLVVFGAPPRGLVLARLVVVSPGILRLQARVHEIVGGTGAEEAPHTSPGNWTPHVTLASRLSPEQLATAITVLGAAPPQGATLAAGRRWDSTAKVIVAL